MYCSACGSKVPDGGAHCTACGASVVAAAGYGVAAAKTRPLEPAAVCPRCGFHGLGDSYFSRSGPLVGLLVLAAMTLPFMGAAGILYYILRHDHRACPRCGAQWGKRSERALPLLAAGRGPSPVMAAVGPDLPTAGLPAGNMAGAIILALFACMMLMVGVAEGEFVAGMFGMMAAGGSALAYRSARTKREARRAALLQALQQPVLRLAGDRGGRLTVTEVASALGWPLPRAEKVLNSLEDGLRIVSDVTDQGVIVYEFREMMLAPRVPPAGPVPGLLTEGIDRTLHA